MDSASLDKQAARLVERLANGCESDNLGSATVSIHDTAWVSMVSRTIDGQLEWRYPECFRYLLKNQNADGSWGVSQGSEDLILNTMSALLALKKHLRVLDPLDHVRSEDLEQRIAKGLFSLDKTLERWDVASSMQVGFEILIPAMINMLAKAGVSVRFPGLLTLQKLNKRKLKRFTTQMLYEKQTPLLHSLEAFVGEIDFDKVGHHKTFGSMLGSPASTAAYLMFASEWDQEAEDYLCRVIRSGSGSGMGGVPSAFPISIFETTWVC